MIDRRKFIYGCSCAFAATTLLPTSLLAGGPPRERSCKFKYGLSRDLFEALKNERFFLRDGSKRVEMTLTGIEDASAKNRRKQFSVLFKGDQGENLPEGLYELKHRRAGTVALSLQPGGDEKGGRHYRAVFCLA